MAIYLELQVIVREIESDDNGDQRTIGPVYRKVLGLVADDNRSVSATLELTDWARHTVREIQMERGLGVEWSVERPI